MGFGTQFRNWVSVLYSNINSCVLVNGWLSESFQVCRGIRQGCPLSALLFILTTDTLSVNIKQDQTVKGIEVGNELEVKIVKGPLTVSMKISPCTIEGTS